MQLNCVLYGLTVGLGKTLQSITLLYMLLVEGFEVNKPICRRVLIITPTSLVSNWQNEIRKWLNDRIQSIAVKESGLSIFIYSGSQLILICISFQGF